MLPVPKPSFLIAGEAGMMIGITDWEFVVECLLVALWAVWDVLFGELILKVNVS